MQQVGAALTDWLCSAACLIGVFTLYRHGSQQQMPRWYLCFIGVYLSEGLACFGGGFMWASGANKHARHMDELTFGQHVVCSVMMLGMVAEGLWLILTSRAMRMNSEDASFVSWAWPEKTAFTVCVALYFIGCAVGMPLTVAYQFLSILAVGLAGSLVSCLMAQLGSSSSAERACWGQLVLGVSLNLVGAIELGLLDNDCTGAGCITEPLPWESSPCRFGSANPPGSSCPLPECFNHAAVMHLLATVSCGVCVPALCTLLDLAWDPRVMKSPRENWLKNYAKSQKA